MHCLLPLIEVQPDLDAVILSLNALWDRKRRTQSSRAHLGLRRRTRPCSTTEVPTHSHTDLFSFATASSSPATPLQVSPHLPVCPILPHSDDDLSLLPVRAAAGLLPYTSTIMSPRPAHLDKEPPTSMHAFSRSESETSWLSSRSPSSAGSVAARLRRISMGLEEARHAEREAQRAVRSSPPFLLE